MKIYRNLNRFFCTPLKRYLPAGALIARYENAVRLIIQDAPQSDQDIFNVLADGFVYDNGSDVTWVYAIEPPPLGTNTSFFTLIGEKTEDAFGNVGATADGLPVVSRLHIRTTDGVIFMQSITNGLWYPIRVVGVDGAAGFEVGQVGIPTVN